MMAIADTKRHLAAEIGGPTVVDYWLLGEAKIDVVEIGDRLVAHMLARSVREAEAKARTANKLFEYFDAVMLALPERVKAPAMPAWIGIERYPGLTIERQPGHGDFRYRGFLAHMKTPALRALLGAHGCSGPTNLSRWSLEQAALELPLAVLRRAATASVMSSG